MAKSGPKPNPTSQMKARAAARVALNQSGALKGMTLAQKKTARKANAVKLGLTGAAGNKMVTRIQKGKPAPKPRPPSKTRGLGNTY